MTQDGVDFGPVFRSTRERLAVSQETAAAQLGVSKNTYRLWEVGAQTPGVRYLPVIATWAGVDVVDVLKDAGVIPRST